MGAGKTTVGRLLAAMSSRYFVDTDREVELKTGASISWIFEKEGEEGFRQREKQVLEQVLSYKNKVIATGGGLVMLPENRKQLGKEKQVVYLYAPLEEQYQRTHKDKKRPLLQNVDPYKKLEELMLVRDPLYREVANLVVPTSGNNARDIATTIMDYFSLKR